MFNFFKLYLVLGALFAPIFLLSSDNLKVGTIDRVPFSYHNEHDRLTGFSVELWEEIAKTLKLDYTWVQSKKFSELTGNVINGKTDIAVANISVTSEREEVADFSYSIFGSGMTIAVKQDSSLSIFDVIIDSGILTFLGAAFLILFLVAHIVWFFERDLHLDDTAYFRTDYRHGIWDAFWWSFILMTTGGLDSDISRRVFNRILAGIWVIASLFFISTLTAKMTTAMTISQLKSDVQTYQDLAGLKVGVTEGSSHEKFLTKKGIHTIPYETLTDMYKDLKEDKLEAIVSDYPILSYYTTHDGADWMMITGKVFNHENYGFMFHDKSPYIESINNVLLQLRESGFYRSLHQKYFGN